MDHNANVYVLDGDSDTPLHCTMFGGQLEVSRLLLDLHSEANLQNAEGSTPLHLASVGFEEGHPDVVQLLLDYSADAQLHNLSGKNTSNIACDSEQQEIVLLLSQYAAE
jgi:ankyrin repeat protein